MGSLITRGLRFAAFPPDEETDISGPTSQMALLGNATQKGAVLSDDGKYRHVLWRQWDKAQPLGFVMLNPSTADASEDDPTIRRCVGFAKREGFGGIRVANLFDLRATNPDELLAADDPIGPQPDPWFSLGIEQGMCRDVVAAWGAIAKPLRWRADHVVRIFGIWRTLHCLGTTKDGSPRHPLYVRGDAPLTEWSPA